MRGKIVSCGSGGCCHHLGAGERIVELAQPSPIEQDDFAERQSAGDSPCKLEIRAKPVNGAKSVSDFPAIAMVPTGKPLGIWTME